jgi:predicted nucleic acid-binding protein
MGFDCVVDANVCAKIFLIESLSPEATALFAHLSDETPAQFYAPDLFYIECANILWKYVQQYGYRAESASQDMNDLLELPITSTPTVQLAGEALKLGVEYSVAAYAAAYVVLSQRLALPLVTADDRLVRRLHHTPYDVRWLGDWP